jgi:hypothetical protein
MINSKFLLGGLWFKFDREALRLLPVLVVSERLRVGRRPSLAVISGGASRAMSESIRIDHDVRGTLSQTPSRVSSGYHDHAHSPDIMIAEPSPPRVVRNAHRILTLNPSRH